MRLVERWYLLVVTLAFFLALSPQSSSYGFVPHGGCSIGRTKYDYHQDSSSSHRANENIEHGITFLEMSRFRGTARNSLDQHWLPRRLLESEFDDLPNDKEIEEMEKRSLELAANVIRKRLASVKSNNDLKATPSIPNTNNTIAKGRFMDLACTTEGEQVLESLFDCEEASQEEETIIQGAIIAIQSLLITGTQLGVLGSPEQLQRSVSHLIESRDEMEKLDQDCISQWDASCVRKLKYRIDKLAGVQLLAELQRKRTPQGAFDLLTELGAWQKHEELPLLRSGFSLRFNEEELTAARNASTLRHDPDTILGLRKDLRHQKIYTIDSASTSEIDDGLAVESIKQNDGSEKLRFWIHIADADRWAPRDSMLFQAAKRRGTSLYLPQGSISMFPSSISTNVMSLKANTDVCALSLGLELADDGSIIDSSIIVMPSVVYVSYRLSYDEVDEMLEEGSGFHEEWQLGALLTAASKRRQFRMRNGSAEAFMPTQIPQYNIGTFPDKNAPDGIGIQFKVQVSHNGGKNQSVVTAGDSDSSSTNEVPVSSASTLVTEMMILAGEAIGKWKLREDRKADTVADDVLKHSIRLPFRTQPAPDYRSRSREKSIMMDLLSHNTGSGFCHAWYSRRFLSPVKVVEQVKPHAGLGLSCYVQWTSPIRRFGDLQVHCAVKRYLRRKRVNDLITHGKEIPPALTGIDLGCDIPVFNSTTGGYTSDIAIYDDINYRDRTALLGAARTLQRQSQRYWLLEYIRRRKEKNQSVNYDALILGCVDPERRQYAVYLYELGFECKYSTPVGSLGAGTVIRLKVASVFPRSGQITLTRASL